MSVAAASSSTCNVDETRWIDAWIRWERDSKDVYDDDVYDDDDEEESDVTPTDTFSFRYPRPTCSSHDDDDDARNGSSIDIELLGFQSESEQTWNSTGLTLWRSSRRLCDYLVQNVHLLRPQKRILELGSGLGLCGLLASQLVTDDCTVVLTDGDTNVLKQLRDNIERNASPNDDVSCQQLLWGAAERARQKFDVILGSDLVYVPCVIEPLFETISAQLCRKNGVFIMAHCARRQGSEVTVDLVLEAAEQAGFRHQLVDEDDDTSIYTFKWEATANDS